MSAVKTPAEARQQAEQEVHGWHARLKVEHKKMNETEKSELCRLIEQEHRWPAPMEIDEDSAKYGSSFRCPITSCHHARGYEQCREQERGWVNELKSQLKRNPWSLKNAGLVNVDGVEKRGDFSFSKWMEGKTYKNKVFGHQHSFQATLECHEEDPEEIAFQAFETKIYIGLTPDMVRFLGEHQNTVDMAVKGRTNTDLIKGIRTTLQEKHGVLYQLYKDSLVQEFIDIKPGTDETHGHWLSTGLVANMAKYEGHLGFTMPDVTKFPLGFSTHDEENDEDILNEAAIADHMRDVEDWWPVMEHLDAKAQLAVKTKAFSKHQVTTEFHNKYASQWHIAIFRQKTYDLCVNIMTAYANSELKGMSKIKETAKSKASKRKSTASTAEAGPAKKKGYKGVSNRQVDTEMVDRSKAVAADKAGAGILQEEVAARQGPPPMAMTFWIVLQGFAGDLEYNKVDQYLNEILNKQMTLNEGQAVISQFKKERQVQKFLVSATGVETWEEVKTALTPYWTSQDKIEGLIGCLSTQKGGARRGAVAVPLQIIRYVENAKEHINQSSQPDNLSRLHLQSVTVKVDKKLSVPAPVAGDDGALAQHDLSEEEPTHEKVTIKPQWKVVQADILGRGLKGIPKLNYTGCILDCVYGMDKEKSPKALTKEGLQKFLEDFNSKTTAPAWTFSIFCGFAQQNDFLEVIDGFCSGRAERFFWKKENCHMNPNKKVRYNNVEVGVTGFHMKAKEADPEIEAVNRPDWMCAFDLSSKQAEKVTRANLFQGFPVVLQLYKREGKTVNPHQKPQALLQELIQTHMMGENPTACGDDLHPKNWILDACCGSGSTAMAALRCGMNVIAFDNDPYMVSSTNMRLNNFEKEHDGATETITNAQAAQVEKEPDSSEDAPVPE